MLTSLVESRLEEQFPGWMSLLSDPQRLVQRDSIGASAALDPRLSFFDVVEAPIAFSASNIRLNCTQCGTARVIFVINAGFLAAIRHLMATSHGKGLPIEDVSLLLQELRADAKRLRRGPHIQDMPPDMTIPGIAWLLFHEVGHATGGAIIDRNKLLFLPEWCREHVAKELDADAIALKIATHRIFATPHAGRPEMRLRSLFDGIELMLRGIDLVDSLDFGRPMHSGAQSQVSDDGAPTPTLRRIILSEQTSVIEQLFSVPPRLADLFGNWDATVEQILRRN